MEVACSSQVPSIQDPAESATGEFLRGLFVFILLDSGPRRVRFSSALLGAHRGKRTRGSASSRGVLYSCTGSTFCHVDVRFSYQWSAPPSRLATCSRHLLTALAHGHLLTATCSRPLAHGNLLAVAHATCAAIFASVCAPNSMTWDAACRCG